MRARGLAGAAAAVGLLAAGCSGQATVSGTVTLDGRPLTTGTVTFHPAAGGPVAYGAVDRSGGYTLAVGTAGELPPGEYRVTVVATEPPSPPANPASAPSPGKPITPPRYADPATTDLVVTVGRGSNTIPLALTSK